MKRWLPFPFVSLALCVLWLLLHQSIAPGQVLLGAALGVAAPLLSRRLQPFGYPRLQAPAMLLRLLAIMAAEVTRSTVNVSRIILFADYSAVNAQFLRVPLKLRDPYGLAMLACLINLNPGTVLVEILADGHELVLHVFDLHDEQWWIDTIRTRYEQPLIAIFETEATNDGSA